MPILKLTDNIAKKPLLKCGDGSELKFGPDCHKILASADFSKTESRNNGFFWSIFDAYCDHHNLYLRPDDVWIQILSQFARYVGHHKLTLQPKFTVSDFLLVSIDTEKINESQIFVATDNYLSTEAKQLITPVFTTTNTTDMMISRLMISCDMNQYYGKLIELKCGIPSVSLEGTIDDWKKLIVMTEKLRQYGQHDGLINSWFDLLIPVLENFLMTAEGNDSIELKRWWNQICDCRSGYSGTTFISGWLAVFCMMSEDSNGFFFNNVMSTDTFRSEWPIIYQDKIPTAFVTVPSVFVKNNNEVTAKIFCGLMGSSFVKDDPYGIRPEPLWIVTQIIPLDNSTNKLIHNHQLNLTKINQRCDFCHKNFKSTYSCIPCDCNICISCASIFKEKSQILVNNDLTQKNTEHESYGITLYVSNIRRNIPVLEYDITPTQNKKFLDGRMTGKINLGIDFKIFYVKPDTSNIQWNSNGFVNACLEAYNQHHDLYLRPDDVWLCIMSQFGIYVNNHTDELRDSVVNFKGKLQLDVSHDEINIDLMAKDFIGQMDKYITDNIKSYATTEFSTTTVHDKLVANLMFLCQMKKYFGTRYYLLCGLPSVTLAGTTTDWELIRDRIISLRKFDIEKYKYLSEWIDLLIPILENFVRTVRGENSDELKKWWNQICHMHPGGSGPTYMSGWLTTFCMMQEDDESCEFVFRNKKTAGKIQSQWPVIDIDDIPAGFLSAPIEIVVNNKVTQCKIYAGMMGISTVKTNKYGIKPVPMWAIANVHVINPILNKMLHIHELNITDKTKGFATHHLCDICREKIITRHACLMCDFDVCFKCADTLHNITVTDHEDQLCLIKNFDNCVQCQTDCEYGYSCLECDVTYCFDCINRCEWKGYENRTNKS